MSEDSATRVTIHGRVQGVGFRYATLREASALGLEGWVRNNPDNTVEAHFQGPPDSVDQIVAWCRKGPRWAAVTDVTIRAAPFDAGLSTFRIID